MVDTLRPSKLTTRSPDPWLAVNYALIFPGLGQVYSRHWTKGSALIAIATTLVLYATWSIFGAQGNTVQGFWAIGFLIGVYSFSILDAYRGTQPGYARRISVPQGRKDPWYAVFLSQIFPGLGHLYVQKVEIGGLLLMVGLVVAWLANQFPVLAPIPPLLWTLSCYHVYKTFPNLRRQQSVAIAMLILGLFLVRLVLGNTPNWVNQSYVQCIVPSDSMVPTLQVGDRLFMHRDRTYEPKPGDIVIFEPPDNLRALLPRRAADTLFVKRIIGVPGQTVQVASGRVLVDGQPLGESYIQSPPLYQWGPEVVPTDSYFVLGDNRNRSSDSHIWGYVPKSKLLGKAYKIYWPPERIQSLE